MSLETVVALSLEKKKPKSGISPRNGTLSALFTSVSFFRPPITNASPFFIVIVEFAERFVTMGLPVGDQPARLFITATMSRVTRSLETMCGVTFKFIPVFTIPLFMFLINDVPRFSFTLILSFGFITAGVGE